MIGPRRPMVVDGPVWIDEVVNWGFRIRDGKRSHAPVERAAPECAARHWRAVGAAIFERWRGVPFVRGVNSVVGWSNSTYGEMLAIMRGSSGSGSTPSLIAVGILRNSQLPAIRAMCLGAML